MPLAELMLTYFLKVPLILKTLAGGTFRVKRTVKLVKSVAKPLRKIIFKKALARDSVSLISIGWLEHTYGISIKRIRKIPNGTNIDLFSPGDQRQSKINLNLDHFEYIIGYVGALRKIGYLDLLIIRLTKIESKKNISLALVGDGTERDSLESLVKELG